MPRRRVERSLRTALGHHGRDVGSVRVRLARQEGDTLCTIRLSVHRCWNLMVQERDPDASLALSRAVERTVRWVREVSTGSPDELPGPA